jgi:putative ABC transport system substrate-binding protein
LALAPIRADAEAGSSLKRIGILYQDTLFVSQIEIFRTALDALGYAEGKAVVYDYRLASATDLEQAARDMVRSGVDLIVAPGTPAAQAALRATASVPIVFFAADPLGSGLVGSLARPGGNITGVATLSPELGAKRVELLRELLPHATRLAVLVNPDNPVSAIQQSALESAARDLGFRLHILSVRRREDVDGALATLNRRQFDAFVIVTDVVLIAHEARIAEHARRGKIPGIYAYRTFVDAGGLLSYGADIRALWQQSAALAEKILKGAKPADLPIEQPTRFEMLVNLKTAKAIGLTIPQSILMRADEVIR